MRAGLRVAAVLGVTVAVLLTLAWALQRRLVYFPAGGPVPPAATVLPGAQDVTFRTGDGLELAGWYVPAAGAGPSTTVLVFNGNAGNRADRAPLAAALSRRGLAVLLFDYRGYGGNPGEPTETGLAADARAARDHLLARPGTGDLVYFGESLGAAVAVGLAAEHPPAALALRSPFTSLADVGRRHYPYLPVGALLKDRYAALDRIPGVRVPLLVVAGGADDLVPAAQSRRLHDAAPGPKRYLEIPGAGHNDPELFAGERLVGAVAALALGG